MHVRRISKAVVIDGNWLEANLPDSLYDLIRTVIGWFKD
jgi:hypothetical protein